MYFRILVRCGQQTGNGARLVRSQRHVIVRPIDGTHQRARYILHNKSLEESYCQRRIGERQFETLTIGFVSQRFRSQLAGDAGQVVERTIGSITGDGRRNPVGFLPVVLIAFCRQEIVVDSDFVASRI